MGEITTYSHVNYVNTVRRVLHDIGYTESGQGFDDQSCAVTVDLHEQSPDIARGVATINERAAGAGDQGIMFGYACRETENYMPVAFELASKLTKRLSYVRQMQTLPFLRPDGKAQVTVEYVNDIPKRIDTVVLSAQHNDTISEEELKLALMDSVIFAVLPEDMLDRDTRYLINPTGRFVMGGPSADTGLTGRKIIADTYGGAARHGGGAFSGKDPSKVDRSAAYMARYLAKNIVASELADRCEVQLGYAIGVKEPVSIAVETFGTQRAPVPEILRLILNCEDLTPYGIISKFDLRRPMYEPLSCYGHFGINAADMPWEKIKWA
jgi:S-adenosylmethionine synthetase